jgi:hypothetical protein
MKKCLWALGALGLIVSAQTTTQSPQQTPPAAEAAKPEAPKPDAAKAGEPPRSVTVVEKDPVYVRRFSAGVTIQYLPLKMMQSNQIQTTSELGPIEVNSDSSPKSRNVAIGGGVVFQAAITGRIALLSGALWRQTGYETTNTIYVGPLRRQIVTEEVTSARFLDFPLLVRRYNIDRTEPGWRWFYEAGGTLRHLWKTRTTIERTENGVVDCCSSGPAEISSRNLPGVTGGFGLQFNDDFGIRIIPEARYTWWLGRTFDSYATRSARHQVEVGVSFTF